MKYKKLIGLLTGLILVSFYFGFKVQGNSEVVPALRSDTGLPRLEEQSTYERILLEKVVVKMITIGGIDDDLFLKVVDVKLDAEENIYVFDFGARMIKKFSKNGRLLATFGNGEGQGPGEFLFPSDFFINLDGEVWIPDPMNGRVDMFSSAGNLEKSIKLSHPIYRIAGKGGHRLLAMHMPSGGVLFSFFDPEQDEQPKQLRALPIGELLLQQDRRAIALDGTIAAGPDGGFVYAPMRLGVLLALDSEGRVRFFRQTLDREPMPKVVTGSDGSMFADREAPLAALKVNVLQNQIFVLNVFESGFRRERVFDVYSYSDGEYLYSFEIPELFFAASVMDGGIATTDGVSVTLWKLDENALTRAQRKEQQG